MKKIIAYIMITISIIDILVVGYLTYKKIYLTSNVPTTTGAIPLQNTSARNLLDLIIKLASQGDLITPQYKISVNQSGRVQIVVYGDFATNKQSALDWLKNNGYDQIPLTQTDFFNPNGVKQ